MPQTASQLLEMIAENQGGAAAPRGFDGIICFGDNDWWYHNHGHYDLQMMRALTSFVPVLYVNSIGMRMPSIAEGAMFARRIARKLRSVGRGYRAVAPGFAVLSPLVVPGAAGMALTDRFLPVQARRAAARLGIARPLVWVVCPTAYRAVEAICPEAVVYQRTDRTESFSGVDARRIKWFDKCLKEESDLTLFASSLLFDHERERCRQAAYVDHGVDFERFDGSDPATCPEPAELSGLPRPRAGFVGSIDDHTFDADLFREVAGRLPQVQFVLVGGCSLPRHWCTAPNVALLGQRPYESVADYMRACDVLIMPWNRSAWISACNPVKLKEYLATGRPVVSTYFHELERYEGLVQIAHDGASFAAAISRAIDAPGAAEPRIARVAHASWSDRATSVLDGLAGQLIYPIHSRSNPVMSLIDAERQRPPESAPPPLALVGGDTPHVPGDARPCAAPAAAPTDAAPAPDLDFESHLERRRALCGLDLAAVVILDGGLRPSPLVATTGRSVLDARVGTGTLLEHWLERIDAVCDGATDLPVRVVFDASQAVPQAPGVSRPHLRIHTDPLPFRGPAGVVRDLCADLPPDRHVLVIEAARFMTISLAELLDHHALRRADVTLALNPDRQPAGLMLLRRAVLDLVPPIGYMDLKEQLLPRAGEEGFDVRVADLSAPGTLPLRTRRHLAIVARYLRSAQSIPARSVPRPSATAFSGPGAPSASITGSVKPRHAS